MAKISTYPSADTPLLLSDRLIGTEAPRIPASPVPLATKNFSLSELLNLFSVNFPAASLQAVLNTGNTATQDIYLTGRIESTVIKPTNIEDAIGSQGTVFQYLSKGASSINWVNLPIDNLQSVLNSGNTATQNITLVGNVTSTYITPGNIKDELLNTGAVGQVLTKSTLGVQWKNSSVPTAAPLADVLLTGNTATNNIILTGNFIKTGGTSLQFLKADGSVDSTLYAPTSRTLTINGVTYDLSADRSWTIASNPGTVTSVGLTMPSAFTVTNSPVTTSGTLTVTGAGVVSQYVRGDGSLANFPSSSGGGSSVAFYLNGSVAQGTFGGVAMKEMDRVPILGAGTDFTIATNGYIQSFITDANVPNQLEIPAGNWNFETYFSASSNGGSPSFYIELYKWNGTTLSLIASNSATPEGITNGTATDLYLSAIAVPQTTLALTDRLAVRIYVNNSGRTIKLHTENSHLCEVITTFSTGLTALNGLTAQVQNFATGTAGTDFGISSATSTHTFNLPTASAANRGALSSADWTTFNGKQAALTLTTTGTSGASTLIGNTLNIPQYAGTNIYNADGSLTAARTLTLNTFALTILGTTSSRFHANGNVGIGTTTDGGYKLDVNGTARVVSDALINGLTVGRGSGSVDGNTVLGFEAGLSNTTGVNNVAVGYGALRSNSTAQFCLAIGLFALKNNTVSNNLAIGTPAMELNTTGSQNTAVGHNSLKTNLTGSFNTTLGASTLRTSTGSNNTAIGYGSGWNDGTNANTTGSNNIFIGLNSIGVSATESNRTWIGNSSTATTWLGGNVLIGTTTDAGFKLDVNGNQRVVGSGSTSATSALTVLNSAATELLVLQNDGFVSSKGNNFWFSNERGFSSVSGGSFATGYRCNATGAYSFAANGGAQGIGGRNSATGNMSAVFGRNTSAYLTGQFAHSSYGFDSLAYGQHSFVTMCRSIVGVSISELFIDAISARAILPSTNSIWQAKIYLVAACNVAGGTTILGDVFSGEYLVTIKRIGGVTTVVGTVSSDEKSDATMSTSIVTIDALTASNALRIRFTPPVTSGATTSINVTATMHLTELRY